MLRSYKLIWKKSAARELRHIPAKKIVRIIKAVENLVENPCPTGTKKLVGAEHTYRMRVGDYRVIYSILQSCLIVEIVRIGHRKDVYRGF